MLLVEGGQIRSLGFGRTPEFSDDITLHRLDAQGDMLLPGFIDLHVHGAMGHELMDASPAGLEEMARCYASHGVTSFLATTWTAGREAITKALELVEEMQGPIRNGATLLGVHLEGPYLHPARCGAQEASHIRRAEREEALLFLDTGVIRLLALAPEFEENQWLIDECVKRGITVSAAHTPASYEQMQTAAARGVSQVTHTFNALQGGAVNIPNTQFEKMTDKLPADKATLLIFYCGGYECMLSHSSAFKADKLGYTNVKFYPAGMPDWKTRSGMVAVSAAHIKKLIDDKAPYALVDARPKRVADKGMIPTAINIPDTDFDKQVDKLPADKTTPIVYYCGGLECVLSDKSADKARKLGYTNVFTYPEGYPEWEKLYGATTAAAAGATTPTAAPAAAAKLLPGKEKGSVTVASFQQVWRDAPGSILQGSRSRRAGSRRERARGRSGAAPGLDPPAQDPVRHVLRGLAPEANRSSFAPRSRS